ncbi:MAG: efflux RND transporter permease subunit [Thermoleophilaceae bacterium]
MLRRLADLAHDRPRRVVAVAFVIALVAGALGGSVADRLEPYGADDPASESIRAGERLEEITGLQPEAGLVALVDGGGERLAAVERELRAHPAVGAVRTVTDSEDGRSAYAVAQFRAGADEEEAADELVAALEERPGVAIGGAVVAQAEVGETVERDLTRAELLAFPLLFLLSLLFFRSVVAALLPLLVGGLAIVGTFLVLRAASEAWDISIFALNLTTGLGLGLAIDYSLFIVSRYREEIARVGPGREALRTTMATAGRTVLFSSLTVAAALAALLTFPQRFLYSMGLGGMSVALIAAAIALIVLPAVLALLGERVNALAPKRLQRAAGRDARPAADGVWYRLSRFVMRRPGRIATASAAFLIALGIPFLGVNWVSVDPSILPAGSEPRLVDQRLASEFPPNRTEPLELLASGASDAELAAYAERVEALDGVAAVAPAESLGQGAALVRAVPEPDAISAAAEQLVHDVRGLQPPFEVLVGGRSAEFVDQKASLGDHLPLAVLIVFAATFVVLFLMTGSVVLPVKAALMNLLTISAAFGVLVLIFQDGRLEGLLDYTSQGGLESTQPLLLFVVAFGLSTDYAVFLLSRIKEARDRGVSDSESVAVGLERTGRIVTAAALLFSVAIGAFVTSEIIFIKQVGLGTAVAVLIDATIVRALLVPSLMELLGRWNWWSPRPLRRLHARIGLSEEAAASRA